MTKYFLLILLVIFPFTVTGCQESPPPNKQTVHHPVLSFMKENGSLKVKEEGKVCLLSEDAIDYEVFVSPDATFIAVETLLMSDLQIVRIYKKDVDNCFRPLKHSVSKKLWHDLSVVKGFSIDEVNHPRMKFLKWLDNKKLQIELSGEVDSKAVDTNVICDLKLLY